MLIFIDLTGQYFGDAEEPKEQQKTAFTFVDTSTDTFVRFNNDSVWTSVESFIEDYEGDQLARFLRLIPEELKTNVSKILVQARCRNCNNDVFVKSYADNCPECGELGFLTKALKPAGNDATGDK